MAKKPPKKKSTQRAPVKRTYLKQSDVPAAALDEALRVPQAILDHYAGKPASPLYVAKALNVDPKGSQLKVLSGAAIAFGLIEGGAQAAAISVTELARRILRPKAENVDLIAKREAVLKPRVFGQFLRDYDGHPFPRRDIALNVLEGMGVPREKAAEVLERIESSATAVGFTEEIKGKLYISLQGAATPAADAVGQVDDETPALDTGADDDDDASQEDHVEPEREPEGKGNMPSLVAKPVGTSGRGTALAAAIVDDQRRRRVFITHGKNRELVDPVKKLLEYGELEPVVSVERPSVSKPVPEKVMDDMRSCGAAIIHVDADRTITDREGTEHMMLNPNVLIEIGAAMAFYGRRFILLVRDGVKLPSNLQGLFEVRYKGDTLDSSSTISLLEAMKDIKNYALPNEPLDEEG